MLSEIASDNNKQDECGEADKLRRGLLHKGEPQNPV